MDAPPSLEILAWVVLKRFLLARLSGLWWDLVPLLARAEKCSPALKQGRCDQSWVIVFLLALQKQFLEPRLPQATCLEP